MPEQFTRQPSVDVEFTIIEEPRDPAFPRFPNVVSHRTHVVRIIVKPRRLPSNTTGLNLSAHIVSHGLDTVSQSEDTFCTARIWGGSRTQHPIPISAPLIFIDVTRAPDDDHLGQGPYDVYITVTPDIPPEDSRDTEGGEPARAEGEEQGQAGEDAVSSVIFIPDPGPIPVVTNQTFCIAFTSM